MQFLITREELALIRKCLGRFPLDSVVRAVNTLDTVAARGAFVEPPAAVPPVSETDADHPAPAYGGVQS